MEVTRIFDLMQNYLDKYPGKQDALAAKVNGTWKTYSIQDFHQASLQFARGLIKAGVKKGDRIALISNNRPEWNFIDFGMQLAGAVNVPIYPTISEFDLHFILNDAGIKYIIASTEELYKKAEESAKDALSVQKVFSIDKVPGLPCWDELLVKEESEETERHIREVKETTKPEEMVTILYTSGTTGNPKGVMLSHDNIVSNFKAVRNLPPVDSNSKALSFLPLNHVYERMLTYLYMYLGVSIYYAESMESIADNLKEIKPEIFTTVPRLLEKVYDKIVAKGQDLTGIKKNLFFWALDLGLKYKEDNRGFFYDVQLNLANKIIFSKWREALGGNVKAIVSGGAALQPRLAKVFWAANIPVLEGYGLTETSPVIAVNTLDPGGKKFGTVGLVLEKITVKIADDGEILCKGPNVMLGYYNRPDLTKEVIDNDGYFHTGDIGEFVEGKYLKITDRKKEIFKTSGGKYIAPQKVENKLKESPFIEQVLVVGENRKFASALVVPNFAYLREWCQRKGIACGTNEEMISSPEVEKRIQLEVSKVNKSLAQYETIKRIELIPREFSIEKGEMTPKLSLKRKVILETWKDALERIYGGED